MLYIAGQVVLCLFCGEIFKLLLISPREHLIGSPFFSKRNAFRMMGGWVAIVSDRNQVLHFRVRRLHDAQARSTAPVHVPRLAQCHMRTLPEVLLIAGCESRLVGAGLRCFPEMATRPFLKGSFLDWQSAF